MNRSLRILLSLVAFSLIAGVASANTDTPRVDRREARQHARVRQGVRSGELTPGEAHQLRADQRHIDRMEDRAKADGKVTPRERRKLARAQNHESRKIYRLKHNARHE